jgi:predicted nucleic acid-binding protein
VIDACSLQNFATVDRLHLLEARFQGRAIWVRAVEYEVRRGIEQTRCLERVLRCTWLGDPVDVPTDDVLALVRVEELRRALGGRADRPTEHLGEAESMYYIETVQRSAIFVTDDRPALDFARNRGIAVMSAAEVLHECYTHREIDCPNAYELLQEMAAHGRGVYVPATHHEVC